jgi:carbon-monoxide dehydrogenase large subunit
LPCAAPVQNKDGSDMASPAHPVLAEGAVHHVGDPVAFVVAETAKQARDAAELVRGRLRPPALGHRPRHRDGRGCAAVWPGVKNNTVFDWEIGDKAATEAEFAKAAHVTTLTVVNNRIVVASMEARAAIADYDEASGRWTLYANTQGGWLIKN